MFHDMIKVSICEACRQRQVAEVISDDDPDEPYRVCCECSVRLQQRGLRPSNGSTSPRHGWRKYLLHDDFYDQNGAANQPEIENSAAGMHAHTLDESTLLAGIVIGKAVLRGYTTQTGSFWSSDLSVWLSPHLTGWAARPSRMCLRNPRSI
jgi:hypothetical protein